MSKLAAMVREMLKEDSRSAAALAKTAGVSVRKVRDLRSGKVEKLPAEDLSALLDVLEEGSGKQQTQPATKYPPQLEAARRFLNNPDAGGAPKPQYVGAEIVED